MVETTLVRTNQLATVRFTRIFLQETELTSDSQIQEFEIHFESEISRPQIISIKDANAAVVKNSGILGTSGCMIIGTLGVASIGAITKLLVEIIKSKNAVEIKIGDKHFRGLTVNEAHELLTRLEVEND